MGWASVSKEYGIFMYGVAAESMTVTDGKVYKTNGGNRDVINRVSKLYLTVCSIVLDMLS